MTNIVLIAAVARNGIIGNKGDLPFQLSSDLKRFKALTMGHPVIMGRTTYESIGRPLPGRPNLVLTGDPNYRADGCEIYHDLDVALERGKMLASGLGKDAVFVLGGAQVYTQAIGDADRLEITHVAMDADGDVSFPVIDPSVWTQAERIEQQAGPKDDADMVFATYQRVEIAA
ncbi:MAG: dihydrofolate reductase [Pseudomonadota bacterium]